MIALSNSTAQTLIPGQSMIFDTVVNKSCHTECHKDNSSYVKLLQKGVVYDISFNGNVAGATADVAVQLSIESSGEVLTGTNMISVPATATTEFNNVFARTLLTNYCCETNKITVTNTGTGNLIIAAGASLVIKN